eukprot:SM000216S06565  [mRNA]  locus=s216:105068:108972:+ [translate_table: standard]
MRQALAARVCPSSPAGAPPLAGRPSPPPLDKRRPADASLRAAALLRLAGHSCRCGAPRALVETRATAHRRLPERRSAGTGSGSSSSASGGAEQDPLSGLHGSSRLPSAAAGDAALIAGLGGCGGGGAGAAAAAAYVTVDRPPLFLHELPPRSPSDRHTVDGGSDGTASCSGGNDGRDSGGGRGGGRRNGRSLGGNRAGAHSSKWLQHTEAAASQRRAMGPSLLVFSGGTAFNGVVEELKLYTTRVAHVLPVSDDGGSTAEIVRVLGGPAIGDIRSRCLRLSDDSSSEAKAVKRLLAHRLPLEAAAAKAEWMDIVEGEHELWRGVSEPYKDTIRAFLILWHASERFLYQNGSVGNFFFAGARTFFRSLDAAIFLYCRVSHIPTESLVLPVDGTIIRGQNEISHPSTGKASHDTLGTVVKAKHSSPPLLAPIKRVFYMSSEGSNHLHEVFPAVNPTILEQLQHVNAIIYGMGSLYTSIMPSLVCLRQSRVREVFSRSANVLHRATSSACSDCGMRNPQVPRGVGEAIAARTCPKVKLIHMYSSCRAESAQVLSCRASYDVANGLSQACGLHNTLDLGAGASTNTCSRLQILFLNGSHDRETAGMTASDFVAAISEELNRRYGEDTERYRHPPSAFVNVLVAPKGGDVPVDIPKLEDMRVTRVVLVKSTTDEKGNAYYNAKALIEALELIINVAPSSGQDDLILERAGSSGLCPIPSMDALL